MCKCEAHPADLKKKWSFFGRLFKTGADDVPERLDMITVQVTNPVRRPGLANPSWKSLNSWPKSVMILEEWW